MEQPTKRCSGQEKKKMAINGSGGVGPVILLGGALVTAALTSAFLVRKRERSSGENCRNTPSTAANELKKTGLQHILLDASPHVQNHASVGRKEVESADNDAASTQVFKRDKKAVIEIKGAISEGIVVNKQEILPLGRKLEVEPKNMMHEVEIRFSEEDASTNENYDFKQVYIEKKDFNSDNGKEEAALEESKVDLAVDGFELCKGNWGDHVAIGRNDFEHENVNREREVSVVQPIEVLEIIREGEAIEGGREGETERDTEKLGEEDEQCNQSNEEIVNVEENGDFGDNDNSLHVLAFVPMPTEVLIDEPNEEVVCQQKGQENDVEEHMEDNINSSDDEADEDDDFSSEEVWPTELLQESSMEPQQEKLIARELGGKIREHKAMKEGKKRDDQIATLKNYSTNSTQWSILVGLLLLFGMSSIFCSWFLSLSFSEFCLTMFFIMLLSKICGFMCTSNFSCKRRLFEN